MEKEKEIEKIIYEQIKKKLTTLKLPINLVHMVLITQYVNTWIKYKYHY